MLQRQLKSTAQNRRTGGEAGSSSSGGRQARLGNAAIQERGAETSTTGPATAVQSAVSDANSFPDGEELQEPGAQGPMRAEELTVGQEGALIGTESKIKLYRGPEKKGRAAATVSDGVAAEVLQIKDDWIKVQVRNGKKNSEGWVSRAVFSDQPGLTRDEENEQLTDDFVYSKIDGDLSPKEPTGKDTAQGFAGDCFFIASMAAVANASPGAIEDMVTYNADKGTYTVRFYEEQGRGKSTPVYIEVDAYLPTAKDNQKDPTYAGDEGGPMWSAIIEKAYAKWKGGYDVIGEGGTGQQALAEITGVRSENKRPSSMKEAEVIPFFTQAKDDGKAIYAGVKNGRKAETSRPFSGRRDGPYKATVTHTHRWNEILPGTVAITDTQGKADEVWDKGEDGDRSGELDGNGVASGTVNYKGDDKDSLELRFEAGAGPDKAEDLEMNFEYEGVLDLDKFIIGNHAYAFENVVGGKELQFYNPWGTYQPKPITPAEFLLNFDSLTTNTPPSNKRKE